MIWELTIKLIPMKKQHPILNEPIEVLGTSLAFREMCKTNGFDTLSSILKLPIDELEKKVGMHAHLLIEFMDIVKRYGLEEMVREDIE